MDVNFWRYNTMGNSGGFAGPTSNVVCRIKNLDSEEVFGCDVSIASSATKYYYYRLQTFNNLAANQKY